MNDFNRITSELGENQLPEAPDKCKGCAVFRYDLSAYKELTRRLQQFADLGADLMNNEVESLGDDEDPILRTLIMGEQIIRDTNDGMKSFVAKMLESCDTSITLLLEALEERAWHCEGKLEVIAKRNDVEYTVTVCPEEPIHNIENFRPHETPAIVTKKYL